MVHKLTFWGLIFRGVSNVCLAKRVLHPIFFTVLPLFFEKQPLPCQGQGLVYYRDWGQEAMREICFTRHSRIPLTEQLGAVREHCFKSACALEGSQKRHQNRYMLTNFELSYRMVVLFALQILNQWTRRESPFSIKKRQEWRKNIFKGPQEP